MSQEIVKVAAPVKDLLKPVSVFGSNATYIVSFAGPILSLSAIVVALVTGFALSLFAFIIMGVVVVGSQIPEVHKKVSSFNNNLKVRLSERATSNAKSLIHGYKENLSCNEVAPSISHIGIMDFFALTPKTIQLTSKNHVDYLDNKTQERLIVAKRESLNAERLAVIEKASADKTEKLSPELQQRLAFKMADKRRWEDQKACDKLRNQKVVTGKVTHELTIGRGKAVVHTAFIPSVGSSFDATLNKIEDLI